MPNPTLDNKLVVATDFGTWSTKTGTSKNGRVCPHCGAPKGSPCVDRELAKGGDSYGSPALHADRLNA